MHCLVVNNGFFYFSHNGITYRLPEGAEPGSELPAMVIGNNNVFEVDSYCQASKIGDNNVLEAKSELQFVVTYLYELSVQISM